MKTIINSMLKTAALVVAQVAILASCSPEKSGNDDDVNEYGNSPASVGSTVEAPAGMHLEEFRQLFIGILSRNDLMQSALTQEIDALSEHLTPALCAQILELAAGEPPQPILNENWLLGFNQLMVGASNRFGGDVVGSFYELAANTNAHTDMRDYASQHYFRTESRLLRGMQAQTDPEILRERLSQVLHKSEALIPRDGQDWGSMPGATLLGLTALAEQFSSQPEELQMLKNKVSEITMPILRQWRDQDPYTRTAALQAASRLHIEQAGEIAWKIANDPNAEIIDRLGAIGALKYYPEQVDSEVLAASCRRNKKLEKAAALLSNNP